VTVHTVFSVVTSPVNDEERIKRYLYDHSAIVATVTVSDRYAAHLLRTDADDLPRAEYLSEYQCNRLASGLFGTRCVGATQTAALNELKHWIDKFV
jgi:hypothetical protein